MSSLGNAPAPHRSSQAVEAILSTLARALPRGNAASSASLLREQQTLTRLSRHFGIADEALRARLKALRQTVHSQPARPTVQSEAEQQSAAPSRASLPVGWERELIELLLVHPEAMPQLAAEIAAEDVVSPMAQQLYELALAAFHSGRQVSFDQLMLAVDDPPLKHFLVDCDEANAARSESDPDQRLADAVAGAQRRRQEIRGQSQLAALHQKQLNPQQEEEVLAELFQQLKQQQNSPQR